MLICKPKDNKILIEDKLNIISDLTQNDVIRDFEATGKILGINSYISENIYEFLTPIGSVYTTSILPLVANKTTELSSDILEHLPETLSIGDYICISENSFKLKEDLDPKVNLSKYLTTKFVRFLHKQAKASQDASSKTYRFIPIQKFTSDSDIDWTKSVDEIDNQLFDKYNLSDEEREHIKNSIKNM